jgi:hypothetical protein
LKRKKERELKKKEKAKKKKLIFNFKPYKSLFKNLRGRELINKRRREIIKGLSFKLIRKRELKRHLKKKKNLNYNISRKSVNLYEFKDIS